MVEDDPHYWAKQASERDAQWHSKQNEITIQSGMAAVRAVFVLNGGAVLALLAFLANVLTAETLDDQQRALMSRIVAQLPTFAWGACLAVVTYALSYVVNKIWLAGSSETTQHLDAPYIRPGPRTAMYNRIGNVMAAVAMLTTAGSIVLFMMGLLAVSDVGPQVIQAIAPATN